MSQLQIKLNKLKFLDMASFNHLQPIAVFPYGLTSIEAPPVEPGDEMWDPVWWRLGGWGPGVVSTAPVCNAEAETQPSPLSLRLSPFTL